MQKSKNWIVAMLIMVVMMVIPVQADERKCNRKDKDCWKYSKYINKKKPKKIICCEAPTVDVSGTWLVETLTYSDCKGYPDEIPPFIVKMRQIGNIIVVTSAFYNFVGKICGNVIEWSGSYDDDGGITTCDALYIQIEDGGMTWRGADAWHWIKDGEICYGTDLMTATKQ